jgi:hypothetical protein
MVEVSPIAIAFLVFLLGFVLFIYLFVRRTVAAFREGQSQSRDR